MESPVEAPKVARGIVLGDMTRHVVEFIRFAISDKNHPPGVYYFGILASACYFESVLEEFSNTWCAAKAAQDKGFNGRLMEAIAKDVSRAAGLEAWKKWTRILYNVDLPKTLGEDWKVLDVLFNLRNQLAHGRTTKFTHFWNAENGRFLGMTIEGSSYEIPFKHLLENAVIEIQKGYVPNAEHLLSEPVVSYFWRVVDRSVSALEQAPELAGLRDGANSGIA